MLSYHSLMTLNRIANSLVTRIVLLGIAFMLLGTVLRLFVLSQYLREDISTVMASQQLALANYVARDVDHKMLERQRLLTQMAATLPLDLLGHPEKLREWLGIRYALQPLFSEGVFVTGKDGMALADYPQRVERDGLDYNDRDYVRAAIAGEISMGTPVMGRVARKPIVPMAAPVRDASGQVRAVLAGITALDAPGFLSFNPQDRIGELGGFLLISPRDHLFIASTNPGMVLRPTPAAGVNLLHDRAMQGYRGTGITVNAQGVEEISAMASVPSTGWFVVARIPTSEALGVVTRTQHFIVKNSLLGAPFFLVMVFFGLMYVFRPLLQAANHADRMTLGEAPLEPLTVVRADEVGDLTAAFNRLLVKLQASQSEMVHMAHHDVLTGLPNRALFADRLSQALARSSRNSTRLGFLYIDLDRFKLVNDSLGHEAGDKALEEIARRLSAIVRETDTLARIGGDEFVVLLGELDNGHAQAETAACDVAAKCLAAIAAPVTIQGEQHSIGASIGIAIGDGQMSPHDLQTAADSAMYKAKQAGGQRFFVASTPA
jgi:diguanylate cyclase (GGDEF)-like protein